MKEHKSEKQIQKKGKMKWIIGCQLVMFLFVLFGFSLIWEQKNFGGVTLNSIVFTMIMPLEGTSGSFVISYLLKGLLPAVLVMILEIVLIWLFRKKWMSKLLKKTGWKESWFLLTRKKAAIFIIGMLALTFGIANYFLEISSFIQSQYEVSTFIEEHYKEPKSTKLVFPEKKRNLIYIFVESGESSLQDKESGGVFDTNYIPEMTQLEKENISFSQNEQFKGANVTVGGGWTMGGMVSEGTGLPLKLAIQGNSMDKFEYFLPGATGLGDILKEEGYYNYFMCGSDLVFGGRKSYLTQHGYENYFDYYSAIDEGKIDKDYFEWWGFEDQKLYSYAKEKLKSIAKQEQPFNFTMLTVDTHHIGGYVCPKCKKDHEDQYGNVWSCASKQVAEFVQWIQQQDFYENTTVVICGDHCSMDPDFYAKYNIQMEQRNVYNVFINSAVKPDKEKNRRFTTLDFFPTTLAALGVQIDGEQLALGVNLFSDKKTLAEEYGYDYFYDELKKKSKFYNESLLFPKK